MRCSTLSNAHSVVPVMNWNSGRRVSSAGWAAVDQQNHLGVHVAVGHDKPVAEGAYTEARTRLASWQARR